MTDIIELANQLGASNYNGSGFFMFSRTDLHAFADAIRQDQIEKDAKICDDNHAHDQAYDIRKQLTKQSYSPGNKAAKV